MRHTYSRIFLCAEHLYTRGQTSESHSQKYLAPEFSGTKMPLKSAGVFWMPTQHSQKTDVAKMLKAAGCSRGRGQPSRYRTVQSVPLTPSPTLLRLFISHGFTAQLCSSELLKALLENVCITLQPLQLYSPSFLYMEFVTLKNC